MQAWVLLYDEQHGHQGEAQAAAKLKVEDKGIVVILEKCYDGNDVDDIDKFNFTTK
jgi:hypothetical protein